MVLIFIASCSQGIVYEQEEFVENDLSIDNFREEVKEVETQIDRKNDAILDFYENNRGSSINLRFLEVNSNSFDFYISQKEEIDISIIGGSKTCNVERNFFAQKGDNTIDFSFCNLEKGEYEILIETSSGNSFSFYFDFEDELVSESIYIGDESEEKLTIDVKELILDTYSLKPGQAVIAQVLVENRGVEDQEAIWISFEIPELNISETTYISNLNAGEDLKSNHMVIFVPESTKEGYYEIKVTLEYDNKEYLYSNFNTLQILKSNNLNNSNLIISYKNNINLIQGESTQFEFTVLNNENYSIPIMPTLNNDLDWGSLSFSRSLVMVKGGDEFTFLVNITPDKDTFGNKEIDFLITRENGMVSNFIIEAYINESTSESLSVGNQSQEKITVDIEVVQIYAMDTSDGEITSEEDTYFVILRLTPESDSVNFSDLILKLDTQTGTQTVEYSSTSSFSSEEYKVDYINNNALVEGSLYPGELVTLSFNAKEDLGLRSVGTIRLLTSNSAVKPVEFTTPSSMVEETTYLYP